MCMAKQMTKALIDECVRFEGPKCLIPARLKPVSRGLMRRLLGFVDGTALLRGGGVSWICLGTTWFGLTLQAMLCAAASRRRGGFRKAELCLPDGAQLGTTHVPAGRGHPGRNRAAPHVRAAAAGRHGGADGVPMQESSMGHASRAPMAPELMRSTPLPPDGGYDTGT
mmetsp:Transcript_62913/g.142035  ORF Transcript_62913/g.142035 Transcript_62913/m.142035 type:complete len:168 (-) Transcript_62913:112-615(-)